MTKFVLFLIVVFIVIAYVAYLKHENITAVLSKLTKSVRNAKNSLIGVFNGEKDTVYDGGVTHPAADLIIIQLIPEKLPGGKICLREYYRNEIAKSDLYEEHEMVGLSISRPDATYGGLKLHGEVNRRGKLDSSHPGTKAALSFNEEAITIFCDDKGFYGAVTNERASVRAWNSDGEFKLLKMEGTFNIVEGTTIRVGNQYLRFSLRETQLQLFDDLKSVMVEDEAAPSPVNMKTAKRVIPRGDALPTQKFESGKQKKGSNSSKVFDFLNPKDSEEIEFKKNSEFDLMFPLD